MKEQSLNGIWTMEWPGGDPVKGKVPGSVYSFLLDAGEMEDPYYRDNELKALALMDNDYTFTRRFEADLAILVAEHQVLRFDGIDTLGEIFLNGVRLGKTDNMHCYREYDVKDILRPGKNTLKVALSSPVAYIREKDKEHHLGGSYESMRGFPHLRKAHCMFGWDWGPRLPDMGIWKDVRLIGWDRARITEVEIRQEHCLPGGRPAMGDPEHGAAALEGAVQVALTVKVSCDGEAPLKISLISPDGREYDMPEGEPFTVPNPALWWPNGLGDQPLYTVRAEIPGERVEKRIGLRTATMCRRKDRFGESFAAQVNGINFFSMGADYIPEDNLLSRMSREKTAHLLKACRECHFNVIRVWGGGIYPMDYFYDLCDELGLLVWQDLMFACANYRVEEAFVRNITEEIRQNVRRLRHHASLGLWCGNNEMEQFALVREYEGTDETAADYLILNEYIIPEILKEEDPDRFYWPSSPSSGGKFLAPTDPNRGDVHYWDVWHGDEPFTAYRKYHFRYLSEFGFQSFPCCETVKSFTLPEDRNIFSYVMEMHQRNAGANGKIMKYLSATYRYPGDLGTLIYASQLLQAEAIRYGVEHFRRSRNEDRCMGAVYWQLNDIWPVASWSSVDYFHRWKALMYFAKRFFAPVLLSCEEEGEASEGRTCVTEPGPVKNTARLSVSNETLENVQGTVQWELRGPLGEVFISGEEDVSVPPLSAVWLPKLDFSSYDRHEVHLSYRMKDCGSTGSVLFCPPKHYRFADPCLSVQADSENGTVTVTAAAYAKAVEVYAEDASVRFDDNFFDMEPGTRTIRVAEGRLVPEKLRVRSVYDIR